MPSHPEQWKVQAAASIEVGRVIFVSEGRQVVREGEAILYHIIWAEFAIIGSTVTTAYRRGTDVSSAVLGGSEASDGNVQTARLITVPAGYGGSTLVIELTALSGGETRKTAMVLDVLAAGQEGG